MPPSPLCSVLRISVAGGLALSPRPVANLCPASVVSSTHLSTYATPPSRCRPLAAPTLVFPSRVLVASAYTRGFSLLSLSIPLGLEHSRHLHVALLLPGSRKRQAIWRLQTYIEDCALAPRPLLHLAFSPSPATLPHDWLDWLTCARGASCRTTRISLRAQCTSNGVDNPLPCRGSIGFPPIA